MAPSHGAERKVTTYNEQAENDLFDSQRLYLSRLNVGETPIVFDVGANIGQSIEGYRKLCPAAEITSFEPLPECFTKLGEVYERSPGITLRNLALAEEPGQRTFHATQCSTLSSLLRPDPRIQEMSPKKNYDFDEIKVEVDTLDGYCKTNRIEFIDILKIDVQGAELSVLHGAKELLSNEKIRMIYLEVICADNYLGQSNLESLIQYLARWHYVMWDFRPFLHTKSGRLWAANAIFMSNQTAAYLENRHPA